ncbi:MAG: hypothetical protein NT144_04090 [Bacteroidia bacterium]|nr:hypothetical protein [Bacteroidia bacterium]
MIIKERLQKVLDKWIPDAAAEKILKTSEEKMKNPPLKVKNDVKQKTSKKLKMQNND